MHPHRAKAKAMHAAKIKGFAAGGRVGSSDLSEPKVKMMKGTEGEGKAFGGPTVPGMKAKGKPHMGGAKKAGTHVNVVVMPHGGGAPAGPAGPGPMPMPAPGMVPPPVRPVAPAPMPGAMGMPPMGGPPIMRKRGGRVEKDGDEAQDKKMTTRMVHEHEAHMHKGERETKLKSKGGVVLKARGGSVDSVSKADPLAKPTLSPDKVSKALPIAKPKYASGGKVSVATMTAKQRQLGIDAGACSGEGRLEKEEKYGGNAGKSAKSSSTS